MKKVTVIGHFGFGLNCLDGQTVKTKIVTEELIRHFGEEQVGKIDTHGGRIKSLLKAPIQVLQAFKTSSNVIILPAHNGLRVYAPLLSFFQKFFRKRRLHYVVIGGWLPKVLKERKHLAKKLKKFYGIYVETNTMKTALKEIGFTNVYVMPNCKNLNILEESQLVYQTEEPYKLCTFSRVMKEKGIEDAVNAVKTVNEHFGREVYSLCIYGQIDCNQIEWFEAQKETFPSYITYGGLVDFDKSTQVLKEYFALLFPTFYEGEGFAGTIIDAFSAGVPVIASDWKYNAEIITEETGYIFPAKNLDEFIRILINVATAPSKILDLKKNCLLEVDNYKSEKVIQVLIKKIGEI